MEETKIVLDKITKIKQSVDDLLSKGLKKELGCVLLLNAELPVELAFIKGANQRKKFAYKAIFNVPQEERYEVQISQ